MRIVITVLALALAIVHVLWPSLRIDPVTLTLLLFAVLPWLARLLKSLELPGGWKIEFRDLQVAKMRADEAGLLSGDLAKTGAFSFQLVAEEDPGLALAGLRIEIEKRLSAIAESHDVDVRHTSVGSLLRILGRNGLLNSEEQSVLADMVGLLNGAVHGAKIDPRAADWAMDVGPRLLVSLDERIKPNCV